MPWLRRACAVLSVFSCLLNITSAALAASEFSGTFVMTAIPVAGIATAYLKDDGEGEKQWLRNLLANQLLNSAARLGFNYTSLGKRPDGTGYGFPSGHVAFAGSGAAFLEERYGWEYGVPAWLATGFVAYVRVDNRDHHWRDVVAASALSYGVGKLFVTPENAVHLAPVLGPDYLGFRLGRSW